MIRFDPTPPASAVQIGPGCRTRVDPTPPPLRCRFALGVGSDSILHPRLCGADCVWIATNVTPMKYVSFEKNYFSFKKKYISFEKKFNQDRHSSLMRPNPSDIGEIPGI
jgi:hypothetical protein